MVTKTVNAEKSIRRGVREHFRGLSYPELLLAFEEMQRMITDRVLKNPDKARRELAAFDKKNPEHLLRSRL